MNLPFYLSQRVGRHVFYGAATSDRYPRFFAYWWFHFVLLSFLQRVVDAVGGYILFESSLTGVRVQVGLSVYETWTFPAPLLDMTRTCPGLQGKSCGAFMAAGDRHTACFRCRGRECSQDLPCPECLDWSQDDWCKHSARVAKRRSLMQPPPGYASDMAAMRADISQLMSAVTQLTALSVVSPNAALGTVPGGTGAMFPARAPTATVTSGAAQVETPSLVSDTRGTDTVVLCDENGNSEQVDTFVSERSPAQILPIHDTQDYIDIHAPSPSSVLSDMDADVSMSDLSSVQRHSSPPMSCFPQGRGKTGAPSWGSSAMSSARDVSGGGPHATAVSSVQGPSVPSGSASHGPPYAPHGSKRPAVAGPGPAPGCSETLSATAPAGALHRDGTSAQARRRRRSRARRRNDGRSEPSASEFEATESTRGPAQPAISAARGPLGPGLAVSLQGLRQQGPMPGARTVSWSPYPTAAPSAGPPPPRRDIPSAPHVAMDGTVTPTVDEVEDSSFTDVLAWIQAEFPGTVMADGPPPKRSRSLLESVLDTHPSPESFSLPLSSGLSQIEEELDATLRGEVPGKHPLPLRKPKLLPMAAFPHRAYRMRDQARPDPVPVNPELERAVTAQRAQAMHKARCEFSHEEAATLESSLRRARAVSSSLDWQLAAAAKTAKRVDTGLGQTDAGRFSRLFLSAARSLSQLQREISTALSNVLLRRRDTVLDLLPSQTPAADLQALRCSSLSSAMLFDPVVVDSTLGQIDSSIQREANLRVSQIAVASARPAGPSYASSQRGGKKRAKQGKGVKKAQPSQSKPSSARTLPFQRTSSGKGRSGRGGSSKPKSRD